MNDREHEETTLPGFAADRAGQDRYAVEPEPHPYHDGQRIRIYIRNGPPAMVTVLRLIHAANANGWRLDKHSDDGDQLVFVHSEREEPR